MSRINRLRDKPLEIKIKIKIEKKKDKKILMEITKSPPLLMDVTSRDAVVKRNNDFNNTAGIRILKPVKNTYPRGSKKVSAKVNINRA